MPTLAWPLRRVAATTLLTLTASALTLPMTAEAAPSPAKVAASGEVYVVKEGDYLAGIAAKLGVRLADLLAVNEITIATVIFPGSELDIPVGGRTTSNTPSQNSSSTNNTPPANAASTYTVRAGDTLIGIATRHGVKLGPLLKANSMTINSNIFPGSTLKLPAGATAATPNNPSPTPATPSAGASSTYVVRSGDYLAGIATEHRVTLAALLKANSMTVHSLIHPGRTLTIPPATLAAKPSAPGKQAQNDGAERDAKIATVLAYVHAQLGKPYKFNTDGPDTFDCSGLTTAAYRQIGIMLPHQSLMQSMKGVAVDWRTEPIKAGDLIFQFSSAKPNVISHVGIAIDSQRWAQAARTGDVVKIGPIPADNRIQAVRRYVD